MFAINWCDTLQLFVIPALYEINPSVKFAIAPKCGELITEQVTPAYRAKKSQLIWFS